MSDTIKQQYYTRVSNTLLKIHDFESYVLKYSVTDDGSYVHSPFT